MTAVAQEGKEKREKFEAEKGERYAGREVTRKEKMMQAKKFEEERA